MIIIIIISTIVNIIVIVIIVIVIIIVMVLIQICFRDGFVELRLDCGTGPGVVVSSTQVLLAFFSTLRPLLLKPLNTVKC